MDDPFGRKARQAVEAAAKKAIKDAAKDAKKWLITLFNFSTFIFFFPSSIWVWILTFVH